MIISVSSLGVSGVDKSTIALMLAVELSHWDVTMLPESTGYHKHYHDTRAKYEKSVLTVAKHIVERGYLRRIIEEFRIPES